MTFEKDALMPLMVGHIMGNFNTKLNSDDLTGIAYVKFMLPYTDVNEKLDYWNNNILLNDTCILLNILLNIKIQKMIIVTLTTIRTKEHALTLLYRPSN